MIYITLPAYNEEKNLSELFECIKNQKWNFEFKILIINDGSTDNTREIVQKFTYELPIILIDHEKNLGLGAALNTAFEYLKKNIKSGDIVITMDADNTHPVGLISKMTSEIESGYDIVIASRFCRGGKTYGVPFYRNLLSFSAATIFKIAFRIKNVSDYTSGFRAFSGRLLRRYFDEVKVPLITESGFAAGTESLIKLSKLTDNIKELPLVLRYDLKVGKSKMKLIKTVLKYLKLLKLSIKQQ